MKKPHLAATALACVVAASLMVGAAAAPREATTSVTSSVEPANVAQSAATAAVENAENSEAAIEKASAEQAAEKKEAEMEAARKAAQAANTNFKNDQKADSSGKSSNSSSTETSAKARTITIDGVTMGYSDSYGTSSAPSSGAGIWRGSDSTTDGSYGYFIGHNPGSFNVVAKAGSGSQIIVNDSNGNSRTYTVVDTFVVARGSMWSDVSDRVTSHGESVALQTCVDGGYKILVAE